MLHTTKIKEILGNKQNIKLKGTAGLNPMFLIPGIFKGYSNEAFLEELIRKNSEIEEDLPGIDFSKVITVITRKT